MLQRTINLVSMIKKDTVFISATNTAKQMFTGLSIAMIYIGFVGIGFLKTIVSLPEEYLMFYTLPLGGVLIFVVSYWQLRGILFLTIFILGGIPAAWALTSGVSVPWAFVLLPLIGGFYFLNLRIAEKKLKAAS